jgi:alginate O-acetyltransferase complex protein AlgI
MLFNSYQFFVFYLIVIVLYYTLHRTFILPLLLIASAVFYCFFIPQYLLILLLVIAIDYSAGIAMHKYPKHKKWFLLTSILSNIGILFFFKYYNFFIANCNQQFDTNWTFTHLILPIGLSFHTFQSLSYIIEVYRGKHPAEKNIGYFALYVLYFPQLVAGPIERPQNVLPQLKIAHPLLWNNILQGSRLILWGLFKKAVIADRISHYVNGVFKNTADHSALQICIGIVFFSIQIYCDFSGYSDMAIGISKTLGIDLMQNFNRPYFAKNIQEFWQRWHISLSTWFRDYVYFPLGGSKGKRWKNVVNIVIVFAVSGLWHGAGWHYIVWGLLHAALLIVFIVSKKYNGIQLPFAWMKSCFDLLSIITTFVIVSICWVFFRAENLHQAIYILHQACQFSTLQNYSVVGSFDGFSFGNINFLYVVMMVVLMFIIEKYSDSELRIFNQNFILDIIFFLFLISTIIFTGIFTKQSFIYFQF